jgi:hypothetical protein
MLPPLAFGCPWKTYQSVRSPIASIVGDEAVRTRCDRSSSPYRHSSRARWLRSIHATPRHMPAFGVVDARPARGAFGNAGPKRPAAAPGCQDEDARLRAVACATASLVV